MRWHLIFPDGRAILFDKLAYALFVGSESKGNIRDGSKFLTLESGGKVVPLKGLGVGSEGSR